jgi:hypothetical protein
MARQLILLALMVLGFIQTIHACEVCGCASQANPGILNGYRNNHVGLSYSSVHFQRGDHPGNSLVDEFINFGLTGSYQVKPWLRVSGFLPYRINTRTKNGLSDSRNGLGDLTITPIFKLSEKQFNNWTYFVETGLGLVFPTGKFDPKIHDANLPENFNPGFGSWGISPLVNLNLQYKKTGIQSNLNVLLYSPTKDGYQFGNQAFFQTFLYHQFSFKNISLSPYLGVLLEQVKQDEYENGNLVKDTGGNGRYFHTGLNIQFNQFLAGFNYVIPVSGSYSGMANTAQPRIQTQLFYNF